VTNRRRRLDRGLSADFMRELEGGPGARIIEEWKAAELDVRIRPRYLTAYDSGRMVGRLTHGPRVGVRLEVHRKYLASTSAESAATGPARGAYPWLEIDRRGAEIYVAALEAIRANAARHKKKEESWEAALLRANARPPTWLIDRQVQVPGTERQVDLVGLSVDPEPAFVVIEIKRGKDNRLQDVAGQLREYMEIIAPDGTLADDVAASYRLVTAQLARLGFAGPDPVLFHSGMTAVGLLVVCRPNPRSRLLGRARAQARADDLDLALLRFDDKRDVRIGGRGDWERL
jgi:hypothetical protein